MKLKNRYLTTIYDDTINKKPITKVIFDIQTLTEKSQVASKPLYKAAILLAKQAQKKKYQSSGAVLGVLLLELIDKNFQTLDKVINEDLRQQDAEKKEVVIANLLSDKSNVFYLASKHDDCAKDHLPYQGKVYIDNRWKSRVREPEMRKRIENYIHAHNTMTIQKVMDRPIWFITRPYCRHYFEKISIKEALGTSAKKLIKKHDMHRKVGDSLDLQTIKVKTVEKYRERLALHQRMFNLYPTAELRRAIDKDKMLIKKWESYERKSKK